MSMKTERRHELQTNTLAVTLARWIEAAKPYSRAALAAGDRGAAWCCSSGCYLSNQNTPPRGRRLERILRRDATRHDDRDPTRSAGRHRPALCRHAASANGRGWRWPTSSSTSGTNRLFDRQERRPATSCRQSAENYPDVAARSARADDAASGRPSAWPGPTKRWAIWTRPAKNIARSARNGPTRPYAAAATARADDLDRRRHEELLRLVCQVRAAASDGQRARHARRPPEFVKDSARRARRRSCRRLVDDKAPRRVLRGARTRRQTAEPNARRRSAGRRAAPPTKPAADRQARRPNAAANEPASDKPAAESEVARSARRAISRHFDGRVRPSAGARPTR